MGRLFVLYALFENVNLFQTYLAKSPSVWWNGRETLQDADKWITAIDQKRKPALFMAVETEEGFIL